MRRRAEAETDERSRDRRHERVAPAFEREAANEARATEADRAQHAELGLPFVAQHEEDVHEQQDPGENREAAERGIELRERLAREIGVVEHTLLHVVDVGGQAGNLRLEHGHDGVGEFGSILHAAAVRDGDERLRGLALDGARVVERGDRARRDETRCTTSSAARARSRRCRAAAETSVTSSRWSSP